MSTPQTLYSGVAASAAAPSGGAGIFQLIFAFLAGGIFFSAFAAAITASIALGKENIQRFLELAKIVASRVWKIFCHGLLVAWQTFYEGKRWQWRESWRVLREQLTLTRKAAREGVEAIKLEANLYAAATGKPFFLQHFVDHFTPKFIAATAEKAFIDSLRNIKNPNIRRLQLSEFSFGRRSPQLMSARVYELGDDGMAFDIDMEWDSELQTKLKLTTRLGMAVPVTVKNIRFDGVVRSVLTPLTADPPGFGAALVSFPVAPKIAFDLRMAGGEITNMPWLRTEIMKAMQKAIAEEFLWPKRVVIPSPAAPSSKPRPMLSNHEIQELGHSDPLLRAETELAANEIYQKTHLKREIPSEESLRMDVLLKDETGAVREGEIASNAGTEEHDAKIGMGEQWKQMLSNIGRITVKEEVALRARRKKYGRKRNIVISFNNPDASERDWIGIFQSGAAHNGEITTDALLVDWFYVCGSKDCEMATKSGRILFAGGTIPVGAYEAYLVKQDCPPYLVKNSTGIEFSVV